MWTWPWCSIALLQAAEDRALKAEAQLILTESRLSDWIEASRTRSNIEENERNSLRADNKLLLDRIVQLSGQPPIFNPLPTPTVAAQPQVVSNLPAPETRASISDVHRAAREAIKKGELHILSEKQ